MQERIAGADTRRDRRAKEMTLPVSWLSDGVCKLMVVGFYRVLRLKHRFTMEIAEVPTAFRLKVKNIDSVRLDMNWSEVKARIVEEQNQTALLMCVTLLPPQFVEPPTEQQADQGSVLALKDVDGVSPTTTSSEDDVAELKTQSPLGVASDEDGEVSEADEAENGVGTVVAVEAVEVCEAGLQRRENELDEAHWVPPPPEGQVSMAIELCVVGVKTCFSIVCDRGRIQFFLSSRSCK